MIAIGTKNIGALFKDNTKRLIEEFKIDALELSVEYGTELYFKGIDVQKMILRFPEPNKDLVQLFIASLGFPKPNKLILLFPEFTEEVNNLRAIYKVGLYDVTLEKLEEWKDKAGNYPSYISFKINPLLYPCKLLEVANENSITTIGYSIFGGEVWSGYVSSMFPEPKFLLEFANTNVDICVLPGDNTDFLVDILGEELVTDKTLHTYSKDLNLLPTLPIPPRKIYPSGKIEVEGFGDIVLNEGPNFKLTPTTPKINMPTVWETEDISYSRFYSAQWIDENYNPRIYKKIYEQVYTDFWVIRVVPRNKLIKWIMGGQTFWLVHGKLIKIPKNATLKL